MLALLTDPAAWAGRRVVTYCTVGYRSGLYAAELLGRGVEALNLAGSLIAPRLGGDVAISHGTINAQGGVDGGVGGGLGPGIRNVAGIIHRRATEDGEEGQEGCRDSNGSHGLRTSRGACRPLRRHWSE